MESKLRKSDIDGEKVVSNFLDNKFYTKFDNFERISDTEQQIKGIDVKFRYNDYDYLCDEKAAIHYMNRNLKTFALELSFFNRKNNLSVGWLLDNKKENNSFLFCWLDDVKDDKLTEDNIKTMEIALIKKEIILRYLEDLDWNKDNLMKKSRRIRQNKMEYMGDLYEDKVRFVSSPKLFEHPVNILLPRQTLIDLSDFSIVLT